MVIMNGEVLEKKFKYMNKKDSDFLRKRMVKL